MYAYDRSASIPAGFNFIPARVRPAFLRSGPYPYMALIYIYTGPVTRPIMWSICSLLLGGPYKHPSIVLRTYAIRAHAYVHAYVNMHKDLQQCMLHRSSKQALTHIHIFIRSSTSMYINNYIIPFYN